MTRARLLAVTLFVVALFAISGLRSDTDLQERTPRLCGPYYYADGRYAGDLGPCPTYRPVPPPETHWSWAPFWEHRG